MIQSEDKPSKMKFSMELLVADEVTESGNVYPMDSVNAIATQINNSRPKITVQEMNVNEKKSKNIPLWEPVKKYTMAVLDRAEVIDGILRVDCETRLTRDGKKLAGMINNLDSDEYKFNPVIYGYGDKKTPHIITVCELKYVDVEAIPQK